MYKVSIIVPVHNTAHFLEQCIASIKSQSLKEIEIILVENASTDHSLELCNQFAQADTCIKVKHLDQGDLSTARNEGVRLASAEYVGFIDSDDTIAPEMFEALYTVAAANDLDVVSCNYVKKYHHRPDKYQYCEDGKIHIVSPKEMVSLNLKEIIPQSACTMLVRKNLAEKNPFPVGKYFEDRFLTFRLIAAASACAYINKSYYHYFQYRGGICLSKTFKRNYDFAESDSERLKFIQESGMFHDSEKPAVAAKSAESFLRKINRMRKNIATHEERSMFQAILKNIPLIPAGTKLSLKARIIRYLVNQYLKKKF